VVFSCRLIFWDYFIYSYTSFGCFVTCFMHNSHGSHSTASWAQCATYYQGVRSSLSFKSALRLSYITSRLVTSLCLFDSTWFPAPTTIFDCSFAAKCLPLTSVHFYWIWILSFMCEGYSNANWLSCYLSSLSWPNILVTYFVRREVCIPYGLIHKSCVTSTLVKKDSKTQVFLGLDKINNEYELSSLFELY